jgi:release factor glutamine methyltransferase
MPPETLQSLLLRGRRELASAGVENPALDARLLLLRAAGLSHEMLISDPKRFVSQPIRENFALLIEKRKSREPVSRILGKREFYGRSFKVTSATLDPRADTETLIEEALRFSPSRILDLGTGTGAIAITLLCELPLATGVATDISAAALGVAKENAARHGVINRLKFIEADWYAGVTERFDLIVSNPPYIATSDIPALASEVRQYDPHLALNGGVDGLTAYRHIAGGARDWLLEKGRVLVEIGCGQKDEVLAIFEEFGFEFDSEKPDLAGHVRCLTFSTN